MLTARSIAAAARQADVGQSTLRRWLREDDNFQNKLRQFREQALSHAALLLQQGAATAVCIMHGLIQSGRPIEPGRVALIRTAIEFAFRAVVYCDIIDRVRTLEKAQRQRAACNPRPAPAPTEPRKTPANPVSGNRVESRTGAGALDALARISQCAFSARTPCGRKEPTYVVVGKHGS